MVDKDGELVLTATAGRLVLGLGTGWGLLSVLNGDGDVPWGWSTLNESWDE